MCYLKILALSIAVLPLASALITTRGNFYGATVRFYTGPSVANYVTYDPTLAGNIPDHSDFNLTRRTMIFFHGWRNSPDSDVITVLLNAYLSNGTFNVLALDWREAAASIRYDAVVSRVQPAITLKCEMSKRSPNLQNLQNFMCFNSHQDNKSHVCTKETHSLLDYSKLQIFSMTVLEDRLAYAVAELIDLWDTQKGVPTSKIHLVGHSIGAHLAGSVGKYTKLWSDQTKSIDRITGLDPAVITDDFLQWRYADFVDIIHTDTLLFGTRMNTGHVDFWPNRSSLIQPQCPPLIVFRACSHERAILLYAESVERAYRTGNFLSTNRDNPSSIIEMGLNCPTSNVRGVYVLQTNGASWFSQS